MKKKVLIIGANGYIGNRLYKDYKDGYDVHCLDPCWFDESKNPKTHRRDYSQIHPNFFSKFDIIILLAGHSSVKLISVLQPHQKFIYASSSSVYGNVGIEEVDETYTNFVPHNHYDITKHIIDLYAPRFDVQYYGLRFGTVNGYSPIVRNDVMINSMVYNGITDGKIKLYVKDIVRPILGIGDLSRAVKEIIDTNKDLRGIYNLASFTSTSGKIAERVSKILKVPIEEFPVDSNNITNSKLQTKNYNFNIDSTKFINAFDQFEFNENIESITKDLVDNFEDIIFTSRNKPWSYE
jgi:nucleoside-diphosphate-sugar epimerase